MTNPIQFSICLFVATGLGTALAQSASGQADDSAAETTTPAPVAFVYVSNTTNPTDFDNLISNVYAYTVAANGELTSVLGSPFKDNVSIQGVNGKYAFGMEADNLTVDSFLMAANGSIKKVSSTNTIDFNPGECGSPGRFKIDHTGTVLYNVTVDPDCFGTHFQSFKIASATGKLEYLGESVEDYPPVFEIDFLGNNQFAYAPICFNTQDIQAAGVYGYQRESSGELKEFNIKATPPSTPQKGNLYCPLTFATDPTDHVAALLQDEDEDQDSIGQPVVAIFTADAKGNLATTNTYHTMPAVKDAYFMRMSPSGKLLAVTGTDGLMILHFNGANPATKFASLLQGQNLAQVAWDNNNHLFAVGANSNGKGKMWVYTVTPTSIIEAPGSPYAIPNPYQVIVQPR